MTNQIIFLRHADTKKDPNVKSINWGLSEVGEEQAQEVANNVTFADVDVIISSEEDKAYLTVQSLANKLDVQIERMSDFNEVMRGDKFLSDEDFKLEKEKQLTDWEYKAYGGESGYQASERFKKGIGKVTSNYQGKKILIVTHGTILNMYFADILNVHSDLFKRWEQTKFCAYGITSDNKVIKDIV